jgi:anti-sigma regulatory factor (Ser/Thr protein kinase)
MNFASTLYLHPILDILLAQIPPTFREEIRLGLQEALVNAAKHGNDLDANKMICVHFSVSNDTFYWIIGDQGVGSNKYLCCPKLNSIDYLPPQNVESGRGIFILKSIFDHVSWDSENSQITLCKEIKAEEKSKFFR